MFVDTAIRIETSHLLASGLQSSSITETWNDAYRLWLNSRGTPNTRRAYRTAWQQLTDFTGK